LRPSTRCRRHGPRVRHLGHLPQQLFYIGHAFPASRLGAERAIGHRYSAVFVCRLGAEVAIGDAIAEADVHSAPSCILTTLIYPTCDQFAISSAMQLAHRRGAKTNRGRRPKRGRPRFPLQRALGKQDPRHCNHLAANENGSHIAVRVKFCLSCVQTTL
jgi:hypothetical protein